jgi:hypothetical protein
MRSQVGFDLHKIEIVKSESNDSSTKHHCSLMARRMKNADGFAVGLEDYSESILGKKSP